MLYLQTFTSNLLLVPLELLGYKNTTLLFLYICFCEILEFFCISIFMPLYFVNVMFRKFL